MKNSKYFFLAIVLIFISCSRYNDLDYQAEENKAVIDIIPILVEADYMLSYNDYKTKRPILYLLKELSGYIDTTYINIDNIDKNDLKLIKSLVDGTIPDRQLNDTIFDKYNNFIVNVLSKKDYEKYHADNYPEKMTKDNNVVFGYLWISRFVFNRQLNKGYLNYTFFCGDACAWGATIEVKKVNNKWTKTRELIGWRA